MASLAAVQCPSCPSDAAIPSFLKDGNGYTITVLECVVCETTWILSHKKEIKEYYDPRPDLWNKMWRKFFREDW